MPQISVLPKDVRNKIAAGEVIERPASVVKELIENAIDARSTDIAIEIVSGGKTLIKVSDNGTGMDREDALLCIERHATSKLRKAEDLCEIRTMGFRGEALPSIASVSKMRLVTGLHGDPAGTALDVVGGEIRDRRDAPAQGTSVEIRDLFFNTPARKKFLKSDHTEVSHIIDAVAREALSHWVIGFRLVIEKQEALLLPPASGVRERVAQIYGHDMTEGLLEIDTHYRGLQMKAFLSKGDNFRNNKAHQYIWINERPVRDALLSHAVYRGFEGVLPREKHPVFFLFLTADPQTVDFNVHPTKREVRFEDKDALYRFVMTAVRDSIKKDRADYAAPFEEPHVRVCDTQAVYESPVAGSAAPSHHHKPEPMELAYLPAIPFIYLGDTFIAFSGKGGLTLLDHHAAHERILYEGLLRGIDPNAHRLLFPRQIRLSHQEYRTIMEHREALAAFGFEIDDFGQDTVIVRALPEPLDKAALRSILSDLSAALAEGASPNRPLRETLAARIACHSSLRGKALLDQAEFLRLLADLKKTAHPDQCPHGRPTRIFLSLDDLKKMFKRK